MVFSVTAKPFWTGSLFFPPTPGDYLLPRPVHPFAVGGPNLRSGEMSESSCTPVASKRGNTLTTPCPAGWYPDPSGKPMQRYFDGADWTDHYAPATPQAAGVITVGGTNHVVHAILALITCGL